MSLTVNQAIEAPRAAMERNIARAICRVQLNGGDPDQPAVRWNGTEMEPQDFPAWRDYLDETRAVIAVLSGWRT